MACSCFVLPSAYAIFLTAIVATVIVIVIVNFLYIVHIAVKPVVRMARHTDQHKNQVLSCNFQNKLRN